MRKILHQEDASTLRVESSVEYITEKLFLSDNIFADKIFAFVWILWTWALEFGEKKINLGLGN